MSRKKDIKLLDTLRHTNPSFYKKVIKLMEKNIHESAKFGIHVYTDPEFRTPPRLQPSPADVYTDPEFADTPSPPRPRGRAATPARGLLVPARQALRPVYVMTPSGRVPFELLPSNIEFTPRQATRLPYPPSPPKPKQKKAKAKAKKSPIKKIYLPR